MAEVTDDFGRVTKLSADLESLSKALNSVVGEAVEYAAGKAEKSSGEFQDEIKKLVKAMEELGDEFKESMDSSKSFVEEVKSAIEYMKKAKSEKSPSQKDSFSEVQKKQAEILQLLVRLQQKATSEKVAKFTTGSTVLGESRRPSPTLKDIGFRPRGRDTEPAMLDPEEYIVSREGTKAAGTPLLDAINKGKIKGFSNGGMVKPAYLSSGSFGGGRDAVDLITDYLKGNKNARYANIEGRAKILIDGDLDENGLKDLEKLRKDFRDMGEDLSVEFTRGWDKNLRTTYARWMTSLGTAYSGGDVWQRLFEGGVKDATEFRRELRKIAFQTEGITGEFKDSQAEFAKIGENIAGRTGKNVTAFYKAYISNSKKGFNNQKTGMKVLESGMKLSTLIGSETQATASLFADWHRELGLGANQMERMATNMQMVARRTGVTGDELIGVMKSSERILKNLRNQGTLTTTAARNITQAMAEFKKQGFEESGEKILGALSGYSAFQSSDEGTQRMMQIAASMGGVDVLGMMHGGVVQDESQMGKMAEGMKTFMAKSLNIDPAKFNFDELTEEQRRMATMVAQSQGTSLGEMEAAIKTLEKGALGLGGTLSDYDKVLANANSTEKQKQEAEKKRNDVLLSSSMGMLGSVAQMTEKYADKGLSDFSDVLKKDTKLRTEFESGAKDMAAMLPYLSSATRSQFGLSGSVEEMAKQMSAMDYGKQKDLRSISAAEQLDKAMKAQGKGSKDFTGRMQQALKNNDTKLFKSLEEEMKASLSEMQVDQAASVDPIEKLELTMNKLNETIRSRLSPLTGALLDFVGATGLFLATLGLMAATLHNIIGVDLIGGLVRGGLGTKLKNLTSAFDNYALNTATSDKVRNGMFKRFATTYAESRTGPGKGVMKSLGTAFKGLGDDMLRGLRGATKATGRFFSKFASGFKHNLKLSGNLFTAMQRGFKRAMLSSATTRKIFASMGGVMKALNLRMVQAFASIHKFSPALATFTKHSFQLGKAFATMKFGQVIPRFATTMRSGLRVFTTGWSAVSKAIRAGGGGFKGVGNLIKLGFKGAKAALVGSTLGTAQIIFSVIDMVFGAVSGFMNTGKRFEGVMKAMGKTTKDVTWGMYASSTIAGALVGILDGLTFGLLSMTGATEVLNNALSLIFYTIFSVIEGIVDGLMLIFRPIWSAIKYIGTQFQGIADSILGVFNAIAGLFGAEAGNWSEAFAMLYPWLRRIGVIIGIIVGGPLMATLYAIVKGISLALVPIQMMFNLIAGVIKIIAGVFKFFIDIFTVGIGQAFKNLGSTIFSAVYGVFKPIVDFIWSLVVDITAPFYWLWDTLVGHSIIPDLVFGIVKFFAMLPLKIFGFLMQIPMMMARALLKIPMMIAGMFSKIGSYLQSFGTDSIFGSMLTQLGVFYSFIADTISNLTSVAYEVLNILGAIFTLDFGKMWESLKSIGTIIVNQVSNIGNFFYKIIKNSALFLFKTLKRIPMMILGLLKSVFVDFPVWLVGKMMDGLAAMGQFFFVTMPKMLWDSFKKTTSSIGKAIWDTVWWPFNKLGEGLKAIFYDLPVWLGSLIADGFKAIFYDLPVWLGQTIWDGMASIAAGIPGALYGALHTAASAIGLGWLVEKLAGGKKSAAGGTAAGGVAAQGVGIGDAGNLAVGTTALIAGGVALKKVAPKVVAASSDAFGKVASVVPKDIGKQASSAFKSIKAAGSGAIDKAGKLIPSSLKQASASLTKTAKSALSPMTKSFSRTMAKGDGVFKAMYNGSKAQVNSILRGRSMNKFASDAAGMFKKTMPSRMSKLASTAFSPFKKLVPTRLTKLATKAFGGIKTAFNPLTKGFTKSMAKGEGVFKAIARGAKGQFASMTRGGSITKFASKAFDKLKKVTPTSITKTATQAFDKLKKVTPTSITKTATETFNRVKGAFSGNVAGKVGGAITKARGFVSGVAGRVSGLASGGTLGRVGTAAKNVVGMAGGALSKVGGMAGGALSKAGGALGKVGGMAGGALGKAGGMLGSVAGKGVGALAKKIPVVGALLDFGLRKAQGQSTGKAAVGAGGGLAGAAAGAAIGTAIFPVVGTAIGAIVGGIGGGWLADKLYDNVGPVFSAVGKSITGAASTIWEGAKSIGTTLWEGASWMGDKIGEAATNAWEGVKSFGSRMWEGTKKLGSRLAEGAKWFKDNVGTAAFGPLGAAFEGVKNFASWLFGGGEKNNENRLAEMSMAQIQAQTVLLSTSVGQHAIPTAKPNEGTKAGEVEPVHLRDITDSILRDRASSGGGKLQSDELTRMEEAAQRQVSELEQIRQGIQELVSLMKPSGDLVGGTEGMNSACTKDSRRPRHAVRYGRMKFGVPGGMANRSVVNTGEV